MSGKGGPYDWDVVARYLCQWHKVSDPSRIACYGPSTLPAYELTRKCTLGIKNDVQASFTAEQSSLVCNWTPNTYRGGPNSDQPLDPVVHPVSHKPCLHDTQNQGVFFNNIVFRRYANETGIELAARLTFQHEPWAKLQDTQQSNDIYEALGGVNAAVVTLPPTPVGEEQDLNCFALRQLGFGYLNEGFIRTVCLLNERNLMNGIVRIPHEVCLQAKLDVWKGAPESDMDLINRLVRSMKLDPTTEQGKAKAVELKAAQDVKLAQKYEGMTHIQEYVAVPADHVLSWGYHSSALTAEHGQCVQPFGYQPQGEGRAPVLQYFLVPDDTFERALASFKETFLAGIYRKPIHTMGVEFVATTPGTSLPAQGKVSLVTYMGYVCVPPVDQQTQDRLAPILSPDFPPAHEWSKDEAARQAAIKRYMAQHDEAVRQGFKKE